jgi:hypothetical protein
MVRRTKESKLDKKNMKNLMGPWGWGGGGGGV